MEKEKKVCDWCGKKVNRVIFINCGEQAICSKCLHDSFVCPRCTRIIHPEAARYGHCDICSGDLGLDK